MKNEAPMRPLTWARYPLPFAIAAVLAQQGALAQSSVEELNSPGVYQIHAPAIYSRTTGANVTAAIVDTGLLTAHPEFAGRVLPGYNAFDGTTNTPDGNGHGTHVAGIVAAGRGNPSASGMFGVAYNAYLMPIKVLNGLGFGSDASISNGIQAAVNRRNSSQVAAQYKPFAMNLSLGSSTPSAQIETALRNGVSSQSGGMVIAAAAGNDGGPNPGYPARYASQAWANGQIIAVGAVDANNVIASFSNRAGDARSFYLVAPGVAVYSTFTDAGQANYESLSGTSMAAPYVTAAATLVKSGWPFLTAKQVSSILFDTAIDLGTPGVDEIYGQGLLNLDRALAPVGALTAPVSGGRSVPLAGTAISASAGSASALQAAGKAGQLQVAALDSYGRDYVVDLAPAVQRPPRTGNGLSQMLAAVDGLSTQTHTQKSASLRIAYRSEVVRLAAGEATTGTHEPFAVSMTYGPGREMFFGLSGMGGQAFGLSGELARLGAYQAVPALANPYFSLAANHTHAGMGWTLASRLRVKLGVLVADPSRPGFEGMPNTNVHRQSLTLGELSGDVPWGVWTMGFGRLVETDAVLGTTQTGALAFSGSAGTNVMALGLASTPTARLRIGAQYVLGYTGDATNGAASLVSHYGSGRSNGYAVFATMSEAFVRGDNLTFTFAQPLRRVSGAMEMTVATHADPSSGAPVMETRSLSLRPDGRELKADMLYFSPIDRRTSWFMRMDVRRHADHDRTAPLETGLGVGVRITL